MKSDTQIQKLEKAAYIFKTIAHPTRLSIIKALIKKNELNVNELINITGCEQSLLSHHLSNLKLRGLLGARKESTMVYYHLKERNLQHVLECIDKCNCTM